MEAPDAPSRGANIDSIISLMMALERAEAQPEPVRLIGWL